MPSTSTCIRRIRDNATGQVLPFVDETARAGLTTLGEHISNIEVSVGAHAGLIAKTENDIAQLIIRLDSDNQALGGRIDEIINGIYNKYDIGDYVITENETSPASKYAGTWEKIEGQFLIGASSEYLVGSTGGEATHTLTKDEMPPHTHGLKQVHSNSTYTDNTKVNINVSAAETKGYTQYTTSVGGGQAHNNMPPYRAVYIWKRVA